MNSRGRSSRSAQTTKDLLNLNTSRRKTKSMAVQLKQALLNTGQAMDTGQFHTQDSQRMTTNVAQVPIKAKPTRLWHFPPSSNQGQAYILMSFLSTYLLPTCDQEHPVQLGPLTFFTEVKSHGLLSFKNTSPQHSRKLPVLGQVGLTG